MYGMGIKIPKWNEHIAISWWFCKNMCWSCLCDRFDVYNKKKYVLNHILWIRMSGVVLMNSKTHCYYGSGLTAFGWT